MIYNIPKEPAGPVWDCDGVQWVNQSLFWSTGNRGIARRSWKDLVRYFCPLTDAPPIKVGAQITAEQALGLPEESVVWPEGVVDVRHALTKYTGFLVCCGYSAGLEDKLREHLGDLFTVLRIGK